MSRAMSARTPPISTAIQMTVESLTPAPAGRAGLTAAGAEMEGCGAGLGGVGLLLLAFDLGGADGGSVTLAIS